MKIDRIRIIWLALVVGCCSLGRVQAQDGDSPRNKPPVAADVTTSADQTQPPAARNIPVRRSATDKEIAARLQGILDATQWFRNCRVEVQEGVVFLEGETHETKYKDWATNLTEKTDDVVAVVNRIAVLQRQWWDLSPAWNQIRSMGHNTIQALPLMGISLIVLLITWFIAGWVAFIIGQMISRRLSNPILQQVGSRIAMVPVFVIGIYIALAICGLTQVAATIVGGTGLLGLIVGIAFRDITENFLASVLISMQRPFELGDQIEVTGIQGIVQSVTTRGTTLMTLDGNYVQIPNSLVYKNVISNFTSNPRIRLALKLPVSNEIDIERAQSAIVRVIGQHSAVCPEPSPVVLVDEVAATTTMLRILCWIDGRQYSQERVRSALLRLSSKTIRDLAESPDQDPSRKFRNGVSSSSANPDETEAEGSLESECQELEEQAKEDARPQNSTNLLSPDKDPQRSSQTT